MAGAVAPKGGPWVGYVISLPGFPWLRGSVHATLGLYFLPFAHYVAHASPIRNDSWYGWTAVPEDMIAHTNRAKARGAVQGDTSGCG